MAEQSVSASTALTLARRVNLFVTLVTPVACWPRALWAVAFVDLGVGITKLDGNIADQFVLETDRLHTRDSLDDSRLAVSDVTNGTDVDSGLPCDNLGGQGAEGLNVQLTWLSLGWEVRPLDSWGRRRLLDGRFWLLESLGI